MNALTASARTALEYGADTQSLVRMRNLLVRESSVFESLLELIYSQEDGEIGSSEIINQIKQDIGNINTVLLEIIEKLDV